MPVGMELEELHVLQGDASVQGDGGAVAGEAVGVAGDLPHAAKAAGGEDQGFGVENVQVAAVDLIGDDAAGPSVGREQQVQHVVLIEEAHVAGDALLVEGLQDHVAGAVGGMTGAAHRFFAEVAGMAAERTLGDLALRRAVEGQSHVFQLVYDLDRLLTHDIDRILIGEIIAAFDRIEGVPFGPVFFPDCPGPRRSLPGQCPYGCGWDRVLSGRPYRCPGRHRERPSGRPPPAPTTTVSNLCVWIIYSIPISRPRPPAPRIIARLPARIKRRPIP